MSDYTVRLDGFSAEGKRRVVEVDVEAADETAAIDEAWRSEWALMRRANSHSSVIAHDRTPVEAEHRRVSIPSSLAYECSMHAACSCGWVQRECGPPSVGFDLHLRRSA